MTLEVSLCQTLTLAILWKESGVITVFLQPFSPTQGRITIANSGDAWSAYWDSMPEPLAEFFVESFDDYLVSKLHQRPITRHETARLKRIIGVVRVALQERLKAEASL